MTDSQRVLRALNELLVSTGWQLEGIRELPGISGLPRWELSFWMPKAQTYAGLVVLAQGPTSMTAFQESTGSHIHFDY